MAVRSSDSTTSDLNLSYSPLEQILVAGSWLLLSLPSLILSPLIIFLILRDRTLSSSSGYRLMMSESVAEMLPLLVRDLLVLPITFLLTSAGESTTGCGHLNDTTSEDHVGIMTRCKRDEPAAGNVTSPLPPVHTSVYSQADYLQQQLLILVVHAIKFWLLQHPLPPPRPGGQPLCAVLFHRRYKQMFTPKVTASLIIACWLAGLIITAAIPLAGVEYHYEPSTFKFVYLPSEALDIYFALDLTLTTITVAALVTTYSYITCKLRMLARSTAPSSTYRKHDIGLYIQVVIVALLFGVSWISWALTTSFANLSDPLIEKWSSYAHNLCYIINYSANPYICLTVNRRIRSRFLVKCGCNSNDRSVTDRREARSTNNSRNTRRILNATPTATLA